MEIKITGTYYTDTRSWLLQASSDDTTQVHVETKHLGIAYLVLSRIVEDFIAETRGHQNENTQK